MPFSPAYGGNTCIESSHLNTQPFTPQLGSGFHAVRDGSLSARKPLSHHTVRRLLVSVKALTMNIFRFVSIVKSN